MTAVRIVGPLPAFENADQRQVGAEAWTALVKPLDDRGVPVAPRGPEVARLLKGLAPRTDLERYGPARLGLGFRVWEVPQPDGGTWEWAESVPELWEARNLFSLNRWALRLVRSTGLDLRANRVWCFRDSAERWWALHQRKHQHYEPPEDSAIGPPFWTLPGREDIHGQGHVPAEFIDAFGGFGGRFHIALTVIEEAVIRGRRMALRREIAEQLQPLMSLSEWRALLSAASELPDPAGGWAKLFGMTNGGSVLRSVFEDGFGFGQTLGLLTAANAVRQSELERARTRSATREALDEELSKIVEIAVAEGNFRPHALARALLAELEGQHTARGRLLKSCGMAMLTQKALGQKLSKLSPGPSKSKS